MLLVIRIDGNYWRRHARMVNTKYTADDYWTARTDNHKVMVLQPRCRCWYDRSNLTSYCKNTWVFILWKNINSFAPRWCDKFLPQPYVDIFEKLIHMLLVLALSIVKLFATLATPCEIHFILLRSRSRTLHILFPLLSILDINFRAHHCCFV